MGAAAVHASWSLLLGRAVDSEAATAAVPAPAHSVAITRRKGCAAVRGSVSGAAVLAGVGVFAAYSRTLAVTAGVIVIALG